MGDVMVGKSRRQIEALLGAQDTGWMERAACRRASPAVFYPQSEAEEAQRTAKAICATCPVKEPCLAYALATKERGIWGGTSEKERRAILRKQRRERAEVSA